MFFHKVLVTNNISIPFVFSELKMEKGFMYIGEDGVSYIQDIYDENIRAKLYLYNDLKSLYKSLNITGEYYWRNFNDEGIKIGKIKKRTFLNKVKDLFNFN